MTGPIPRFETYFAKDRPWAEEFRALRAILLECGLEEELKWRQPCYTFTGANVVILSGFKAFCALGFFKGVLMPDPAGILVPPGPNSKGSRILKFTGVDEIAGREALLKSYVRAAIAVETSGAKVDFSANKDVTRPAELEAALEKDEALRKAFNALTPGRQRGWILQFEGAKQSATRAGRIAKAAPAILRGLGPHDGYKLKAR